MAASGLRARPLRAALSALGIAIGTAAIVAVLGLSASSQAGLLAEIDRLGTNLLTAEAGRRLTGGAATLPHEAPGRIGRLDGVTALAHTGVVERAFVYRSALVPAESTQGLQVRAASLDLPRVLGLGLARGRWLDAATARAPVVVLGADAAQRLGIDRILPRQQLRLGGQAFTVAGVLRRSPLVPDLDAAALIGYPAARTFLAADVPPSAVYVRAATDRVTDVQERLGATASPAAPNEVDVSQPSDALTARAAAAGAFDALFLGLGLVALVVGAVGVANTMVVSVLERRTEVGLRRALGATRNQVRAQFLTEAVLLAALGGGAGVVVGALATAVYARTKGWPVVVPPEAWLGGVGAAVLIGALAGLAPAVRAARLPPAVALRPT